MHYSQRGDLSRDINFNETVVVVKKINDFQHSARNIKHANCIFVKLYAYSKT